jgi:hypothetical protein
MSLRTVVLAAAALAACCAWLALPHGKAARDWVLAEFLEEAGRQEVLERRLEASLRLGEGKKEVMVEVTAGRLTLREAAVRFRRLHAQFPAASEGILRVFQVDSGEEQLCRNVLFWVVGELENRPAPGLAVVARLEAEFRQHFGHPSGVPVPRRIRMGSG